MPKTIELHAIDAWDLCPGSHPYAGKYRNLTPCYNVHLTLQEIRGLQLINYSYMTWSLYGGHDCSYPVNDIFTKLCARFPNLNNGLGYKLCGQGEQAGDIRGLLHQHRGGLLRRLLAIIDEAHKIPESHLVALEAEQIKE